MKKAFSRSSPPNQTGKLTGTAFTALIVGGAALLSHEANIRHTAQREHYEMIARSELSKLQEASLDGHGQVFVDPTRRSGEFHSQEPVIQPFMPASSRDNAVRHAGVTYAVDFSRGTVCTDVPKDCHDIAAERNPDVQKAVRLMRTALTAQ